MKKPWRFREEADEEVAEAYVWYHGERRGLGDELQGAIESAMESLVEMPTMATPVYTTRRGRVVRRFLLRRFPYAVVFVELDDHFQVVAVAHLHRHPDYWRERVER